MLVTTIHGVLAAEQLPTRTYAALSAALAPAPADSSWGFGLGSSYHGILQRALKKNTDIWRICKSSQKSNVLTNPLILNQKNKAAKSSQKSNYKLKKSIKPPSTSNSMQQSPTKFSGILWCFSTIFWHSICNLRGRQKFSVFPRFIPTYCSHTWLCFHFCRGSSTLGGSIGYVLAASHASDPPLLPKKKGENPWKILILVGTFVCCCFLFFWIGSVRWKW